MERILLTSLLLAACGSPSDFSNAAEASEAVDTDAATLADAGPPPAVNVHIPPGIGLPSNYPLDSGASPAVPEEDSEPFWDEEDEKVAWQCTGSADSQVSARDPSVDGKLHCTAGQHPSPASWSALSTQGGNDRFVEYEALTFWACGAGTVRVEIPSKRPEEDRYGVLIELTDHWQEYRIAWSTLSSVELDRFGPHTAYGLTFWLNSPWHDDAVATNLWVDDVRFTSASTPLSPPGEPCPS